jgi:hypothetical protein
MKTRLTKLGLIGAARPRPRSYFRRSGRPHSDLRVMYQYENEVAA